MYTKVSGVFESEFSSSVLVLAIEDLVRVNLHELITLVFDIPVQLLDQHAHALFVTKI